MNKKLLKSLFAVVLAFAGIFAISHYASAAVRGDVNGDGTCTASDVTALYNYILYNDNSAIVNGDQNGDGTITASDVTAVYNIILGLVPQYESVYILGNQATWDPTSGQEMETEDGVIYTAVYDAKDISSGYSWFGFSTKLASPDSEDPWAEIADYRFGAQSEGSFLVTDELLGQELTLVSEGYKSFKIPVGKWNFSVNLETMKLVITKVEEPQPETQVWVLGEVNGNTWDPTNGVQMTIEDNNVFTAHVTTAGENDGYSYFSFTKALADAESETPWDDIAAQRFGAVGDGDFLVTSEMAGQPISLTAEGYQAIKIPAGEFDLTVNLEYMTLVIEGNIVDPVEPQPETKVWILGEVNGKTWSATDGVEMTKGEGNIYTAHVTTAGENDGYSYFSFTKALADAESETPWDDIAAQRFGATGEGDFLVTSEMAGQPIALTAEGYQAIKIPAGEFDLTVNLDAMTLVIEGNIVDPVEPQPETKVWILGDVNGNSWATNNGVEMTTEDGKIFTANITVSEGFGYFSFTKKLSENADDWTGIADYRFGAVGESDVVIADEQLNTDLELTAEGYQAFKIAAGEFTLTLDLENMKLKVNGEFAEQPEPENNWYLIGTNNGWSTSDKSYKFTQDENNTNVYSIHVGNVNGEFWFKIANEDCYSAGEFWSGTILSFAVNGVNPLSGNLVQGNEGAFCLPANYNATYLDITIDVENLTYTITTDGQEPQVNPDAEYDYLYIAGDADGWSGNGGKVASVKDANDYYGFFTAGTKFKFQKFQGDWGTNWGGSNGTLVSGGADIPASGYVYVNANLNNMTYSVTEITSMAIIGDATDGGWDNDTPLTYNAADGTWVAEGVELNEGFIKIRANNSWDINFGVSDNEEQMISDDGDPINLVAGGNNIGIPGTKYYDIVLKMVCPGEYTLTISIQPNGFWE